ncbi:MAG: hypothetical protein Q9170_000499 [Blastenia crenularia]
MGGKKAKQSMRPSSNSATNEQSSHEVIFNGPPSRQPVTDTPFSIDMFQQPAGPNDDPNQPTTMRTVVHIRPESIWASLTKYNNFTMRCEKYCVHQYAVVSRFQPLPKPLDPFDAGADAGADAEVSCIARILEIRAFDPQNVYVRVYWLYRPEEVSGGRKPYHGSNEMIATNHMEIVDALRVLKSVDVQHLKEEDQVELPKEGIYWRQTFHYLTQELSTPKSHCVCHENTNPECPTIRCTNYHCRLVLHEDCIINDALTKIQENKELIYDHSIHAITSQRLRSLGWRRMLYTELQTGRTWEIDFYCLVCGTRIEKPMVAAED